MTGDPEQVGSLLEREKPHLVLLDLLLPGTDGIGLMERLPMLSRVEGRLRKNSYVLQKHENPSEERRNFMTALKIGNDYRASLGPDGSPAPHAG